MIVAPDGQPQHPRVVMAGAVPFCFQPTKQQGLPSAPPRGRCDMLEEPGGLSGVRHLAAVRHGTGRRAGVRTCCAVARQDDRGTRWGVMRAYLTPAPARAPASCPPGTGSGETTRHRRPVRRPASSTAARLELSRGGAQSQPRWRRPGGAAGQPHHSSRRRGIRCGVVHDVQPGAQIVQLGLAGLLVHQAVEVAQSALEAWPVGLQRGRPRRPRAPAGPSPAAHGTTSAERLRRCRRTA